MPALTGFALRLCVENNSRPPNPGLLPQGEGESSAAAKHWQKQGLFKTIKGDYPAFGKPSAKLTDDEWQTCRSIAIERLHGLNWLRGRGANWDKVPTDT